MSYDLKTGDLIKEWALNLGTLAALDDFTFVSDFVMAGADFTGNKAFTYNLTSNSIIKVLASDL